MLFGIKWLDPAWLQSEYGAAFIWISLAIIFVECGLFFPFLPGDTLLFALGLFIAGSNSTGYTVLGISNEPAQLLIAMSLLIVAAFAGNVAGYEIGRRIGPPLYERDGRILKKKYFDQTTAFFDRHGNKALVIGRFVPIVRTFITVVAGVSRMDRRRFFTWSAVGAVLWAAGITILGYFLGQAFPWLTDKLEIAILLVVAVSLLPAVYEIVRHRRRAKAIAAETFEAASDIADHAKGSDRQA